MTDYTQDPLQLAMERARHREEMEGIGTQSEKLVHLTLKYYLEPDDSCHEVKVGRYTADIFRKETGQILEIQTRSFERLRSKLNAFLPEYPVTVVYPCVHTKYLTWVDPESGETTKQHKSPKTGQFTEVLPELYRLQDLISHPNLSVLVLLLDMEEFRLLDGYSKDKKHGSHRMERLPLSVAGELLLTKPEDYRQLVPESLPEEFHRDEIMKAMKMRERKGSYAITALERTGAIRRIGLDGKKLVYTRG